MRALPLLTLAFGVSLGAGCRSDGSGPTSGKGSFSVSWVGADTGKLSATPRAAFCTEGNHLEILASRGDLGVGLAIYPQAELGEGTYAGFNPAADTIPRPGVSAAARWFTEREIEAFQSDRGTLDLKRKGEAFSGGFALHLRKVGADTDTIVLNGHFSGVIPGPCGADTVSLVDSTE
jgi:hypothetical protein